MAKAKQPAMTKHPNGTASFCIRVATHSGGLMEICAERANPIADVVKSLEKYTEMLRKCEARGE